MIKFLNMLARPRTTSGTNPSSSPSYLPYLLAISQAIMYPFTWLYCNEHSLSISENSIVRGLACCMIHYALCLLTGSSTHLTN
jgi:hypothetical protein